MSNEVTGKISSPSPHPLLLGHRGARANKSIPENTLASFDQAIADGCDGFEFDVRMTADGEAVVCHDAKIKTKSGSVEIAEAKARALKDLPRLDQVLKRYCGSAFLDIELKVAGSEKQVCELLRRYRPRRGFVVSSFLPNALRDLRVEDQHLPLGLICETRAQLERWRELPVDYVIVRYSLATARLIRELQHAKKRIFVWTVNNEAVARKFQKLGVEGIISDDTRMLARAFEIRPGLKVTKKV
jgi:glycerophosphoryl diester phosphodiesterase